MKKFLFAILIALTGFAQQVFASNNVVNNTSCDIRVTAVIYSASTATSCSVIITCMTVTVAAHSTATLPGCVAVGTDDLLGFDVCWADAICATVPCVSIGNSTGPYPCASFPAGPVSMPACGSCSPTTTPVTVTWVRATAGGANLVIG